MKNWKAIAIGAVIAVTLLSLFGFAVIVGGTLMARALAPEPPPAAPVASETVRQERPPVPIIDIARSEDPNNRVVHLMACAQGIPAACVSAGAWIIDHGEKGREVTVCMHAKGPPEDVEYCTALGARWPE